MEAKDLMIGDYVRTFRGEYGRVTSIYIFQHTNNSIDVCGKTYDEDRIEAIPLTEEMLEKNGFKIYEHGDPLGSLWEIHGTCLLFETTSLPTRFYTKWRLCDEFNILAVQYVHELQHALLIIWQTISKYNDMENIDIVNAWLKISEADGIDTTLSKSSCSGKKRYCATIDVGMLFHFSNTDADVMKAIERTINQYSNWVIQNESNKK